MCGCPAVSPGAGPPRSPPPAVLGPGDEAVTLRQVSSLGGPRCGHSPRGGGTGTLLVWSWLKKRGFGVRQGESPSRRGPAAALGTQGTATAVAIIRPLPVPSTIEITAVDLALLSFLGLLARET